MLTIANLVIEVTRKCMLNCAHCLRGDSQNKTFNSFRSLEQLTELEPHIFRLTFAGGEPFLELQIMIDILKLFKFNKVTVDQIYIATSAVVPNLDYKKLNEFLLLTDELVDWVSIRQTNTDASSSLIIGFSNDYYHRESVKQLKLSYNKVLVAISRDRTNIEDCRDVIPIGRGAYIGTNTDKYHMIMSNAQTGIVIEGDDEDQTVMIDFIYMTHDGRCFNENNLSYEMMDIPEEYDIKVMTVNDILKIVNEDFLDNSLIIEKD